MDAFQFLTFFITSATVLLAFLVFVIHFKNHFFDGPIYQGISFLLFALALRFVTIYLYLNDLIFDYPHFLMVDHLTSRIGLPVMFLIIYLSIFPRPLKWFDGLHFVIPILFIINFAQVYFGPVSQKLEILDKVYAEGFEAAWYYGMFVSEVWILFLKHVPQYSYAIAIGFLLVVPGNLKKIPIPILKFFKMAFLFLFTNLLPVVYFSIVPQINIAWLVSSLIGLGSTLFLLTIAFLIPDFLYSSKKIYHLNQDGSIIMRPTTTGVTDNGLFEKINQIFISKKLFLDPDFSLNKLEKRFGISGRYISESIKNSTGMNFAQYLNRARINYFKEQCERREFYKNKTIEELAQEIGYNSVNNFYMYFKKIEGCTPKDYLKKID
jgi:AraC-like DNA-binding protein